MILTKWEKLLFFQNHPFVVLLCNYTLLRAKVKKFRKRQKFVFETLE